MKFSIFIFKASIMAIALIPLAFGETKSNDGTQSDGDAYLFLSSIQASESEAQGMSSYEIAQEISSLKQRMKLKRKPNDSIFSNMDDPDSIKATGYLSVLKKRRDHGEPEAAFQYGIHELSICYVMHKNAGRDLAQPVCSSAMDSLRLAAEAKDPRAMKALGAMHNEGIGQSESRYVAADWFIKASKQYDIEGNREGALQALEEALKAVPDHPSALELRKKLLK